MKRFKKIGGICLIFLISPLWGEAVKGGEIKLKRWPYMRIKQESIQEEDEEISSYLNSGFQRDTSQTLQEVSPDSSFLDSFSSDSSASDWTKKTKKPLKKPKKGTWNKRNKRGQWTKEEEEA